MHTSNNAGLNPMGFGMQQRYLGMSTGGINVNPTTNQNGLMRTLGNTGMKKLRTGIPVFERAVYWYEKYR